MHEAHDARELISSLMGAQTRSPCKAGDSSKRSDPPWAQVSAGMGSPRICSEIVFVHPTGAHGGRAPQQLSCCKLHELATLHAATGAGDARPLPGRFPPK